MASALQGDRATPPSIGKPYQFYPTVEDEEAISAAACGRTPDSRYHVPHRHKEDQPATATDKTHPGYQQLTKTLNSLQLGHAKTMVVGILGKSLWSKQNAATELLGRAVFVEHYSDEHGPNKSNSARAASPVIELFHDTEKAIVYLILATAPQYIDREEEFQYLKAVLYLFHICHVILVVHSRPIFDIRYLRMFRILQNVKQHISPSIYAHLSASVHLSNYKFNSSNSPGRCTPTLCFVFVPGVSSGAAALKKLQQSLESQIRLLLRKCHLLHYDSSSIPLFTLDPKCFVQFISLPAGQTPLSVYSLFSAFDEAPSSALTNHFSSQPPSPSLLSSSPFVVPIELLTQVDAADTAEAAMAPPDHSLSAFVGYLSKALHHPPPGPSAKRSELPNARNWFVVAQVLQPVFLRAGLAPHAATSVSIVATKPFRRTASESTLHTLSTASGELTDKLRGFLDADTKFSIAVCHYAMSTAHEAYLHDLPPAPAPYPAPVHARQVARAMRVFAAHARGPAAEAFSERLREECLKEWTVTGRMLCDAESLTGRPCVYRIVAVDDAPHGTCRYRHVVSENVIDKDSKSPKIIDSTTTTTTTSDSAADPVPHSSGFRSLNACSCGRTRRMRDDPFDLRAANHTFFMEFDCCGEQTGTAPGTTVLTGRPMTCFQLPAVGTHHAGAANAVDNDAEATEAVQRTAERTAMEFASWVVCKLGAAEDYRPDLGVQQEGFLNGYHFLLPWKQGTAAPSTASTPGGREGRRSRHDRSSSRHAVERTGEHVEGAPSSAINAASQVSTADGYVGVEYECPLGHRFYWYPTAPESPVKGGKASSKRGGGHVAMSTAAADGSGIPTAPALLTAAMTEQLLGADLQVYVQCLCSKSPQQPVVAQLQRITVVTAAAPIRTAFAPRVVFVKANALHEPRWAFDMGDLGTITMETAEIEVPPSSIVTLRMPYVYAVKDGPLVQTPAMPYMAFLVRGPVVFGTTKQG